MELAFHTPVFYQGTIPVGEASANERFYILDNEQNLQPAGQTGEIAIGGGRIGDRTEIKRNWVRIDREDVEKAVLQASAGVLADAAASLRSTSGGASKFMIVYVVFLNENLAEDRSKFLQTLLAELTLPRTMRPSALIPVDNLPRTVAGKVDRRGIASLPILLGISHRMEPETEDAVGSLALSKTERTL
ncbi:beta-ketoacyl synthase domain-containing protein [Colletotrichum tofieldiae]|nr:beta-ketoacyl synthase domain-containing protein [Colletotrichum tofieldiae]